MIFGVNPLLLKKKAGGIPTDYIAYYTMTNVSGSTLLDETGTYDMTISGAVVSGDYMDFDGVDDYTESNAIPALSGDCAVCFWMIPDTAPANNNFEYPWGQRQALTFIHDHTGATVSGTSIRRHTGGFNITTPNSNVTDTTNPTFILTMVDSGTMYDYRGDTVAGSIALNTYESGGTKFNIGCYQTDSGTARTAFFPGKIKSFRVYDRALTSTEISALASEF